MIVNETSVHSTIQLHEITESPDLYDPRDTRLRRKSPGARAPHLSGHTAAAIFGHDRETITRRSRLRCPRGGHEAERRCCRTVRHESVQLRQARRSVLHLCARRQRHREEVGAPSATN